MSVQGKDRPIDLQETTDYIQILLQGSGVDLNYENLRSELESGNGSIHSSVHQTSNLSPFKLTPAKPSDTKREMPASLGKLDHSQKHDLDNLLKGITEDAKLASETRNQNFEYVDSLQSRLKSLENELEVYKRSTSIHSQPPRIPTPKMEYSEPTKQEMDRLLIRIENLCSQNEVLQSQLQNIHVENHIIKQEKSDSQDISRLNQMIEKLTNDNEILRLELLSRPPVEKITKNNLTRELIKRDKQLYFEGVSMESKLASEVASKLGIKNPKHLPACVDRICSAVKLIPQMRNFIEDIKKLVNGDGMNLEQIVTAVSKLKLNDLKSSESIKTETSTEIYSNLNKSRINGGKDILPPFPESGNGVEEVSGANLTSLTQSLLNETEISQNIHNQTELIDHKRDAVISELQRQLVEYQVICLSYS